MLRIVRVGYPECWDGVFATNKNLNNKQVQQPGIVLSTFDVQSLFSDGGRCQPRGWVLLVDEGQDGSVGEMSSLGQLASNNIFVPSTHCKVCLNQN